MYLFFDTETTGLPKDWKAPVTNLNNWPRMVQIAWLEYSAEGILLSENNFIIRPEGYTIPSNMVNIHGISTERAMNEGTDLNSVLINFSETIKKSNFLVAHNMKFDEKIAGAEFLRKGMVNLIPKKPRFCTMEAATDFCKIDGPYGYKWPKLSELHLKLFAESIEETHNALDDIKVTAKCFWEMKKSGLIPQKSGETIKIKNEPPQFFASL
jgi:DNA polymerase III subunit epsilon